MRYRFLFTVLVSVACCAAASAASPNFAGTYVGHAESGACTMTLTAGSDGTIRGVLAQPGGTERFLGTVNGEELVGATQPDDPAERAEIHLHFEGGHLILEALVSNGAPLRMEFTRQGALSTARPAQMRSATAVAVKPKRPSAVGKIASTVAAYPPVFINGVRLTDDLLRTMEQQYRMRIPAGRYWYDRQCGAWGLQGGRTLGFTLAGVAIGGPIHSDASNGHTGVFINGRQLPTADVRVLAQIIAQPVRRGRYWVDAAGNTGLEGSPVVLINLFQAANARNGGGRQKSWYSAGAGGYMGSDGQTTYFLDPNGGSAMIGG